ncbi:hypothetical protein IHE61_31080 [Streptomyces sp. GKU 257-1]|nr:hypothetical protein [Streptomyces sp. GKU 257-1]
MPEPRPTGGHRQDHADSHPPPGTHHQHQGEPHDHHRHPRAQHHPAPTRSPCCASPQQSSRYAAASSPRAVSGRPSRPPRSSSGTTSRAPTPRDYGIPRDHIERAYAAQADTAAAAAYAWCADLSNADTSYRTKLAAVVRHPATVERDMPLLCSGVSAWRTDRDRAQRHADRLTEAERSRPQGHKGDRLTVEGTVTYVKALPSKKYAYHQQSRNLLTFRDDDFNVYVWEAQTDNVPAKGTRITLRGTVSGHSTYRNQRTGSTTAQTEVIRCRWNILQTA